MAQLNLDEEFEPAAETVRLCAAQATIVLDHVREVSGPGEGRASRKLIGEAIGLLVNEYKLDSEAAWGSFAADGLIRRSSGAMWPATRSRRPTRPAGVLWQVVDC